MNGVYVTYFTAGRLPGRTCVGVTGLALGALVEIDLIVRGACALRPGIAARTFLRQDVPNRHHYGYPLLFSLGLRRIPRYPVAKARACSPSEVTSTA